jgi:hypothetical protein
VWLRGEGSTERRVGRLAWRDRRVVPVRRGVPVLGPAAVAVPPAAAKRGRLLQDRRASSLGISPASLTPLDRLAVFGRTGMGALAYEPELGEGVAAPRRVDLDHDRTDLHDVTRVLRRNTRRFCDLEHSRQIGLPPSGDGHAVLAAGSVGAGQIVGRGEPPTAVFLHQAHLLGVVVAVVVEGRQAMIGVQQPTEGVDVPVTACHRPIEALHDEPATAQAAGDEPRLGHVEPRALGELSDLALNLTSTRRCSTLGATRAPWGVPPAGTHRGAAARVVPRPQLPAGRARTRSPAGRGWAQARTVQGHAAADREVAASTEDPLISIGPPPRYVSLTLPCRSDRIHPTAGTGVTVP